MEEFKSFIVTNWSVILEYALMFVAYFLVFLCRKSTLGTKQNIDLAFTQFSTRFEENARDAKGKLEASLNAYRIAIDTIDTLQKRVKRLEETITILVEDVSEVEDYDE